MAPLQRFHLLSQHLFDDSETDEGFTIVQVPTVPLQLPLAVKPALSKVVHFSDSMDVCMIENKTNFSEEVKSQIWYKKKEFNCFKDSCRRIVDWISNRSHHRHSFGPFDEDEEDVHYCTRGLERYSREGTTRYLERMNAKWNDLYVLRLTGATPTEVAELMALHSEPCVAEAQERARDDARAVSRYQMERRKQELKDTMPNLMPRVRMIRDQRDEYH